MKYLFLIALLFFSGCSKESNVLSPITDLFKKKTVVDTVIRVDEAKNLEIIDYDEV
jgi:hypothetical protein